MEARRFAEDGRTIVLIGHAGHEEVVGTTGQAPDRTILVQSPDEARTVRIDDPDNLSYLTQTTLSVDETNEILDILRERFPGDRRTAARGHLLRDDEPPGRRQGARATGGRDARDRVEELVELEPARRGQPGARDARVPGGRRDATSTRRGSRASERSA